MTELRCISTTNSGTMRCFRMILLGDYFRNTPKRLGTAAVKEMLGHRNFFAVPDELLKI